MPPYLNSTPACKKASHHLPAFSPFRPSTLNVNSLFYDCQMAFLIPILICGDLTPLKVLLLQRHGYSEPASLRLVIVALNSLNANLSTLFEGSDCIDPYQYRRASS